MAIDFKEKFVKYLNRDFRSNKRDLIEFTKAHSSGVFQDYNETSPGMAILETVAYIGDVLSFYQDMQFNEVRFETAKKLENVSSFARSLGYQPSGNRPSRGIVALFIEVPAKNQGGELVPDDAYSPVIKAGTKLQGPNSVIFETLTDVAMSASAPTENTFNQRFVTGSQFDQTTGLPTHFALRKDVEVISAETSSETFSIGSFQQFRTIELADDDVVEILSVEDSDGNSWYEVDYLTEETVFEGVANTGDDSDTVPYVMKLKAVPRRFFSRRDPITNKTSLTFGSGDGTNFDDELVPNFADYALPTNGRSTISSVALDPQNFLKTRTLGLSPFNTTLTVTYRKGGGPQCNVPAGSVRTVNEAVMEFSSTNLDVAKKSSVQSSIECINVNKIEGGAPADSITDIKANASAFFASQARIVTREDSIARLFSLPAKFGKVYKAFVKNNSTNSLARDLHILTLNSDGLFSQATVTLRNNIKKYLSKYRIMTDGYNILNTDIINLKIDFGVVISPKFNRNEVLAKCLSTLKDMFTNDNMQIGQPIVISDIVAQLQAIGGVVSVYDVKIKKAVGVENGRTYTDATNGEVGSFDVSANTQSGIVYCPENSIFQIKYPNVDISGESK